MRWTLRFFGFVAAIPAFATLALWAWVTFVRPDVLQLASAYAAKTVCSNVFIAKRDVDAIVRTDLLALEPIFHLMKIEVSAADQRVGASLFGLFPARCAEYVEGWGCTVISSDKSWDRPRALPTSAQTESDALWPAGEKAQLSSNKRLLAAVNDPILQGP
ncbi:MAG: hypothetical protein JO004_11240, partial [Methylobacteriaceae bacterium]|nr:hypothetical protein [Methylobacteriaceae bacterium]